MWDDPIPSVDEDAQPFDQPGPPDAVTWTDGQIMRLEKEWHGAQRSFAYHPTIGIIPLRGDPPYEYQLDYRLRTLILNEAGELQYVDEVSMHLWLPPGFPNQAPVVRPMIGVFHPNVSWEGVYLTQPWEPGDTLVDLAARVGELLAFRNYDPQSVVNPTAMDWLTQNAGILPLDSRSDFSPYAGGEPLGRITRLGPATLETIRRALDDMRFALLAEEGAPTPAEVEDFSRQTRAALSLFLDSDVSDRLREQASEFDDWCRELPASLPLWDYLRRQRSRAARTEIASTALADAAAAFNSALEELEGLVRGPEAFSPAAAANLIPPMKMLQPLQLKLPSLAREFEDHAAELRGLLDAMREATPQVSIASDGSLGRRLASQGETVRATVESAGRIGHAALEKFQGLLRRATPETQALEQVVGWREYMDMFAKAKSLEKQVHEWGSEGVQAFFLSNSSGTFGPFQFEEPIDLGDSRIVVRNEQRGQIDVINSLGQDVLGRGDNGSVTVVMGAGAETSGYETTFRLTDRCDDLIVQFSFIQEQTIDALSKLQLPIAGANSWCGVISRLLSDPHQQQHLRDSHRKAAHRWKALIGDVAALSQFKERLASYRLVVRMSEEVPRLQDLIVRTKASLKDATQKLQAIMGKCSRDVETDRLIIPPKLAKAYSDEMGVRDAAKQEILRLENLLKQIGRELTARLASRGQVGRPQTPQFRALAHLPEAMAGLEEAMGDAALAGLVSGLEARLGVRIPINAPPPPRVAQTAARPARPTLDPDASLNFYDAASANAQNGQAAVGPTGTAGVPPGDMPVPAQRGGTAPEE